jgi:hypothetical protein
MVGIPLTRKNPLALLEGFLLLRGHGVLKHEAVHVLKLQFNSHTQDGGNWPRLKFSLEILSDHALEVLCVCQFILATY